MKILITGASGMLGVYICRELLRAGHQVTGYSRSAPVIDGIAWMQGNVLDFDRLLRASRRQQSIIHLAAITGPGRASPERLIADNVAGTANVLEAAVREGVPKVVFASSAAALGFSFPKRRMVPQYFPVDEEHPAEPQDPYGLSKLLGEVTCKSYSDAYGLQTLCLRVNGTWYTDAEGAALVVKCSWARGLTVEQLWTGRYVRTIEDSTDDWPTPGPPSPRRNLWAVTDARDIGQAFRLAVENTALLHEVFLLNADDTCSRLPTRTLLARDYPEVPLKAPLEGYASTISHEKATRLLGFQPRHTWRDSDFARWLAAVETPDSRPQ